MPNEGWELEKVDCCVLPSKVGLLLPLGRATQWANSKTACRAED